MEIVFENLDYIEIQPENIKFLELGDFDLDIERNGMFARADIVKKISFVISHKEQKAIDRILKQKDISKISILYENSHDYIYTNWIGSFIEKSFLSSIIFDIFAFFLFSFMFSFFIINPF